MLTPRALVGTKPKMTDDDRRFCSFVCKDLTAPLVEVAVVLAIANFNPARPGKVLTMDDSVPSGFCHGKIARAKNSVKGWCRGCWRDRRFAFVACLRFSSKLDFHGVQPRFWRRMLSRR